jgi:autotransporter-associated beta strand protein
LVNGAPQGDGSTWNNTQTTSPAASNWNNGGKYDYFYDFDTVTFNDTGSPSHTVSLTTANSPGSVTVNTSSSYTFSGSGSITGPGAVTVQVGQLNLNTANSYSGGTNINAAGGITAGVAGALPSTGTVVVSGTLDINGHNQSIGTLSDGGVSTGTITNGGSALATLTTTGATSSTYSGIIKDGSTNATALSVADSANSLTLTGANTYSSGTTLTSGTLNINNGSAGSSTSSAIGTGPLTLNGGTINTSLSGLTLGTNNAVTIGGSFTFGGTNNINFGSGAVSISGSPTITLNGSGSALTFGGAASFTSNANATATVNGAGNTLNLGSLALNSGAATVTDTLAGSANINISGAVTNGGAGTNGLTYAGTGALTLAGGDSQTGAILVSSGRLNLTGGTVNGPSSLTVANGAILNITGASVTLPNASGSPALNFAVGNSNPQVFISGGSLTYGINAGGDQNQAMQAGTYTQTGGAVSTDESDMAGVAGQTYTFYLGGGTYNSGIGEYANFTVGTRGLTNAYVDGGTLTVSGGATNPASGDKNQLLVGAQYSGGTAGTREFVQQGGTVNTNGLSLGGFVASAVNSPGVYYLNGGTLYTNALNRGYDTNANEGTGTLNFGGGTLASNTAAFTTDANVVTNVNSGGANFNTANGNITFAGAIAAGTTGNVSGFSGLSGGSGYTADPTVTISGGGGSGATAVAIINASGAVTDIIITNPGSGYTSAPTFTIAAPSSGTQATVASTSIATGNGGVTETGPNALILNGANTYTGPTTVSSGTITMGATSTFASTAFNVGSGATLNTSLLSAGFTLGSGKTLSATGGAGTTSAVNGLLTLSGGVINTGAKVEGATGVGQGTTLQIGSLTISSGNINFTLPTDNGLGNSLINVTTSGGLTINGGNIGLTGGTFNVNQSYNLTFDLIQFTGAIGGTGSLSVNPLSMVDGLNYAFGTGGGYVTLTISGTPLLIDKWTTDGGGSWNTTTNWSTGAAPSGSGVAVRFAGDPGTHTTLARNITLDGAQTVGTLILEAPNGEAYTLSQGSSTGGLTLDNVANGAPAQITVSGTQTIDSTVAVQLTSNTQIGVANGTDKLTIGGVISNTSSSATLTKTGLGTLVLSSANSYGPSSGTVGTNVNGGTIQLGASGSLGAGDVSLGSGSTIQSGASGLTLANNFIIGSGNSASFDTNGNNTIISGVISDVGGTGALIAANSGAASTLFITGAETYGGGTTINSGVTLNVGNNTGSGALPSTGAIVNNGTLTFQRSDASTLTVANAISGSGALVDNSPLALLQLSGANSFTGGVTLTSGTIQLGSATALGSVNNTVTTSASTLLDLNGNSPTLNILTGAGNIDNTSATAATLTLGGNNGASTITGIVSNSGGGATSLVKNGTGTVTIGSGTAGGLSTSGSVTLNGGNLVIGGTGSSTAAISVTGVATSNLTIQDNAVVNSSAELFVVSENGNTYPQPSSLTVTGAASVTAPSLSLGNNSKGATINVTIAQSASLNVAGAFQLISNQGGSTQSANTVNLNGGSLSVGSFTNHLTLGSVTEIETLNLNGGILNANASDASGTVTFLPALTDLTVNAGASGAIINTNGFSDTIAAVIHHSGTPATDGGLTKNGAGTLTLTGANSYTGATTVNAGTLILDGADTYSSATSIASGATLQLGDGTSGHDGTIANTSGITDNGTLVYNRFAAQTTDRQITGTGSVTISGPGSQTLSNTGNSYSGGTTVSAGGTLIVTGGLTGNGAVTVNGTLGGTGNGTTTGIIDGAVTESTGGNIAPGVGLSTAGSTLTLGSNLTLGASAGLTFNLDGGGASDLLAIGGSLTLDSGNTDTLTLNLLNFGSVTTPETFTIATYNGSVGGATFGAGNANVIVNGGTLQSVNYDVTDGSLSAITVTVVPEPGTWASLIGGLGILVVWQRSRRRRTS